MVYQHRRRQGPAGVAADPARRPDGPAGPTPIGLGTLTTRRSRRMRSAREERVRRHGGDADEPHADPPVVVTVKGAEVAGWSSLREAVNNRLLAERCEICARTVGLEVHHIRKLADLNKPGRRERPTWTRLMAMRRRKTLVICRRCHEDIHAGRATKPIRL